MPIHVLSEETINRIAAGEVVERPLNVVKELVENAIDAGADAITCEIRGGGIELIRITDNGCGIPADQVRKAFLRHSTSKIRDERDLLSLQTLGFRGEALSSIAAVSRIEMITKTRDSLTGIRAVSRDTAQGSEEAVIDLEEIGAPDGTTVFVRNLFYNVPVRRRFLRQPQTEAGYITDLIERQALSHPGISFHYRVNGQEKLHTTGNGKLKDLIYRIYGREISERILPLKAENGGYQLEGFIGRPEISRTSRNFEVFFVNGRMLKSDLLSRALEEGYRTDLMQHRFPFAILHLQLPPEQIDVNIHPSKMEIHFADRQAVFDFINESVHGVLHQVELIPEATIRTDKEAARAARAEEEERRAAAAADPHPEPFERARRARLDREALTPDPAEEAGEIPAPEAGAAAAAEEPAPYGEEPVRTRPGGEALVVEEDFVFEDRRLLAGETGPEEETGPGPEGTYVQASLFEPVDEALPADHVLSEEAAPDFRIIGQVFETYWLIQYQDQMLMIDQHAAHEKVMFERFMAFFEKNQDQPAPSQQLMPAAVITLSGREEAAFEACRESLRRMGYEIEAFGGGSFLIRAVPLALYSNEPADLLHEILEEAMEERLKGTPRAILTRIATMSCKAAVKGNTIMGLTEAEELIRSLLKLDNPYHCPHGRPTIVSISKRDMDKKFKRII